LPELFFVTELVNFKITAVSRAVFDVLLCCSYLVLGF